jgi:hypothetical protein
LPAFYIHLCVSLFVTFCPFLLPSLTFSSPKCSHIIWPGAHSWTYFVGARFSTRTVESTRATNRNVSSLYSQRSPLNICKQWTFGSTAWWTHAMQ